MAEFYRKPEEKFYYVDGQKYVHENVYKERVNTLLNTTQSCQKRYIDAENLLLDILKNRFVSFIFGKRIKKHIEKYRNHKLNF